MNKLDLIRKAKEITMSGLPFMEGKEKTELGNGQLYCVKEYGYLKSEDGDFVVVADEKTFAFGGSVLTDNFRKLEDQLTESEISELLADGIEILITKKKSKVNKREYTACEFFPEQ